LFDATAAVGAGDVPAALRTVQRLSDSGRDAGQFLDDLEEHARALLVAQVLGEVPSELRVTPEQDERLAEQSRSVGRAQVVRLLDLLAAAMEARKAGADARIQLELALVKAAAPDLDPSQRALLARVERLEQALPGERPAAVEPPPAAPAPRRAEAGPEPQAPPAASAAPATAVTVAPEEAPEAAEPPDLESMVSLWPPVIETVHARHSLLAAHLGHARPARVTDETLVLAFAEAHDFSRRQAEEPANRAILGQAIQSVTGRSVKLAYELRDGEPEAAEAPPALSGDELVERVMAEFDAEEILPDDDREREGR